jgi:hypothetical protein
VPGFTKRYGLKQLVYFERHDASAILREKISSIRVFSGKVASGFPSRRAATRAAQRVENAANARKLEHIQFPWKLNV